MVGYRNYFIFSVLVHLLVLMAMIVHFSKVIVGNDKSEVIQASLYSADFIAKQIPMASLEKQTEGRQKKTVSNEGIYQVKSQAIKTYSSQQQRLLTKKLAPGAQNKLLQVIHDAIARHQQYPQQAAFLNETGKCDSPFYTSTTRRS